jgi:hypothetical protein
MQELPDLTHSVKYEVVETASKEALTAKWQEWVQQAGELCTCFAIFPCLFWAGGTVLYRDLTL